MQLSLAQLPFQMKEKNFRERSLIESRATEKRKCGSQEFQEIAQGMRRTGIT